MSVCATLAKLAWICHFLSALLSGALKPAVAGRDSMDIGSRVAGCIQCGDARLQPHPHFGLLAKANRVVCAQVPHASFQLMPRFAT